MKKLQMHDWKCDVFKTAVLKSVDLLNKWPGALSGETHPRRSHFCSLSPILKVINSESIWNDFSPAKSVVRVGGAAQGAEWRCVARNKPMSGLLFLKIF